MKRRPPRIRPARILQALKATLLLGAALDAGAGAWRIYSAFAEPHPGVAAGARYAWGGPVALMVMGAVAALAAYDFERLRPVAGWVALAHTGAGALGLLTHRDPASWAVLALGLAQLALWRSSG